MRPGGGKSKGSAFEAKIARALSCWLTDGADDSQLIWSVQSGGWRGNRGPEPFRQVGDHSPNGPAGEEFLRHFVTECKHYAVIDFWHLFTRAPGENLAGWWSVLNTKIGQLPLPRPAPLIIFRMNRRPIMVALPPKILPPGKPALLGLQCNALDAVYIPLNDFLKVTPDAYFERVVAWRNRRKGGT